MMFRSVVLPPPDGPVITTKEPGSTLKAMSFKTRISLRRPTAGNTFLRTKTDKGWLSGAICSPSP